jgi:hypothetical protein
MQCVDCCRVTYVKYRYELVPGTGTLAHDSACYTLSCTWYLVPGTVVPRAVPFAAALTGVLPLLAIFYGQVPSKSPRDNVRTSVRCMELFSHHKYS